jgi:hypothetical protein
MVQVLARIAGDRRIAIGVHTAAVVLAASVFAATGALAQDKPAPSPDNAQAQPAQSQSPAELFAKHGLIGTFAQPCTPPSRQNAHIEHRPAAAGGQVERRLMTGEAAPAATATIDSVSEEGGKRLQISQVGANGRVTYVVEVDKDRFRTFESKLADGKVLVAGGRFTADNAETQWLVKCAP